jgi:hypothetical protein
MHPDPQPEWPGAEEIETALGQVIAACGGDTRAAVRALIVANDFLEAEVNELMMAVSHAYVRGRLKPIPDRSGNE